ncbi:MAG: hypothetical protein A3E78_12040 [Alphaproteobacteria bacterium RIFCSPHIGHO2_12_FULL_63_12]|nr:MAG: hypothetical protein A3E78_12040 [Alphaproteobacteria bacterium RIFCSPHIGHO2_12_FULL_63_12]
MTKPTTPKLDVRAVLAVFGDTVREQAETLTAAGLPTSPKRLEGWIGRRSIPMLGFLGLLAAAKTMDERRFVLERFLEWE